MTDAYVPDPWAQTLPPPGATVPVQPGANGTYIGAGNQPYVQTTQDDPQARRAVLGGPAAAAAAPAQTTQPAYVDSPWAGAEGGGMGVVPSAPPTLHAAPEAFTNPFIGVPAAFLRSGANAISGGFADKFAAAIPAVQAAFTNPGDDQGRTAFHDAYERAYPIEQGKSADLASWYPSAAAPGGVVGTVVQGALLPEAKGAGVVDRLLAGSAQGGLLGGVDAGGQPNATLGSTLTGTALGAATGGAGNTLLGPGLTNDVLAPYERVGVDPMLAVNGSKGVQKIAQAAKGFPLVGAPLEAAAARTSGQLSSGLQARAQQLGPGITTPFEAGYALQQGANRAIVGMKTTADGLYAPVNALGADQTPLPLPNTQAAIAAEQAKFPTLGASYLARAAPEMSDIGQRIADANGNMTFGEMRALRTDIGTKLSDMNINDTDQARLKTLYGSLSQDIQAGAQQLGGPQAAQALSRADSYWSGVQQRTNDTLSTALNASSPEAAYAKVMAAAKSGSGADLQTVQRLKRSLDPDSWNQFAAGTIQNLGRQPDGTFSPLAFATQYGKLSIAGRQALFGRGGLGQDMDAFSQIARDQQAASKFYNHSNSGHVGGLVGAITLGGEAFREHGLAAAPYLAAMGTMGYGAARLLSSPGFARTMLRATQSDPATADGMFAQFAQAHPAVADSVNAFRKRLPGVGIAAATAAQTGAPVPTTSAAAQ